jgi:hypothetical protein
MIGFGSPEVFRAVSLGYTIEGSSLKTCILIAVTTVALFGGATGLALADSPLALDYVVTDTGLGVYQYDFTLTLTNDDGSWSPGQGYGWIIFGDANQSDSPLSDFQMDPAQFPVGPWTSLTSSVGYHNGPTFNYVLDKWVPSDIGDTLQWTGFSAVFLDQDQLLFSSLYGDRFAPVEFVIATLDQGP